MTDKQDYYETMGVSRDASQDEIKKAYRRLARRHHPDVNSHDTKQAETRFKEINEAYQILSDPEKREIYNRYGHQGIDQNYGQNAGSTDFGGFGDIFDIFFGNGASQGGRGRNPAERGSDLRYDLELTLEEAARGIEHTIKIRRMETCDTCAGSGAQPGTQTETCNVCGGAGQVRQQQQSFFGTQIRITTCPKCHGEGRVISSPCDKCSGNGRMRRSVEKTVNIPAGVDSGMRVRLAGEGDAGLRGGPRGDLYIITNVKAHDYFERRGHDLWCQVEIGFPLAAIGGSVEVRTIDGTEELDLSAGTQPGEVYQLRGRGMPDPTGGGRGSLNVVLKVTTPTHLNSEQKELLRQFADSRGDVIKNAEGKSFFERMKDVFSGQ